MGEESVFGGVEISYFEPRSRPPGYLSITALPIYNDYCLLTHSEFFQLFLD